MDTERSLGSQYRLTVPLGGGATGELWRAVDRAGRPWAVKVLRPDLAGDPAIVRRFVQERELLASVDHPNVIGVHDLVVEGGTLAIVMELVQGPDLRAVLRAGHRHQEPGRPAPDRPPPARVARWGAELAAALLAAHVRGVVHRDVKPENVLLDEARTPPECRLGDFGIARLIDDDGHATPTAGTPAYLAPELAHGRPPTPASDVYALGITLYELCCGVTPYAGLGSPIAVLRAHAYDQPGRPDGIPDEFWTLILRMTAKDPADRPTAGHACAELEALSVRLAGMPAAAWLEHPPAPLPLPDPAAGAVVPGTSHAAGPGSSRPAGARAVFARHGQVISFAVAAVLTFAVVATAWWLLARPQPVQPTNVANAAPTSPTSPTAPTSPASAAPSSVLSSPTDPVPGIYPDVRATRGARECGRFDDSPYAAVAIGNSSTTCEFALKVREAYLAGGVNGADVTINAYSPKTHKDYEMRCSGEQPAVCTGGNRALVLVYGGRLVTE